MENTYTNPVTEKTRELGVIHPIEAMYGSRSSLWNCALDDGSVSQELYDEAKKYYGKMWDYVGD